MYGSELTVSHLNRFITRHLPTLPNDKILALSNGKHLQTTISTRLKWPIVFDSVENMCGKRRKCWLPAFSTFPTLFSIGFLLSHGHRKSSTVKSERIQINFYPKTFSTVLDRIYQGPVSTLCAV